MRSERLRRVFQRTDGRCHLCGKGLVFANYARPVKEFPSAWEIEHSRPRSQGGTDHLNNLYAAHVRCNRRKGTGASRTYRARNGLRRSPMGRVERDRIRSGNMFTGAVTGALLGVRAGAPGALVGAAVGALLGSGDPEED